MTLCAAHAHVCVHARTYSHVRVHAYTYICARACTHTFACALACMHTYTCPPPPFRLFFHTDRHGFLSVVQMTEPLDHLCWCACVRACVRVLCMCVMCVLFELRVFVRASVQRAGVGACAQQSVSLCTRCRRQQRWASQTDGHTQREKRREKSTEGKVPG